VGAEAEPWWALRGKVTMVKMRVKKAETASRLFQNEKEEVAFF